MENICIGEVRGQKQAKAGLLIAAIGRHNVLLVGPPGEGKTLLVSTMKGFLPPLTSKEEKELRFIYGQDYPIDRPVIQVSPAVTSSSLLGGGQIPTAGQISLAHSGILFMDEFPEYDKGLLESLRGPIEDRFICITRKGETRKFPCNFQLIAAMNPCPCGYSGYSECTCNDSAIDRYRAKLSAPLLDRIDIQLEVERLNSEERFQEPTVNQSEQFYSKVLKATEFRIESRGQDFPNKDISGVEVWSAESPLIRWEPDALEWFKDSIDKKKFSSRKATRLAKVARSVSDLFLQEKVTSEYLKLASSFVDKGLLGC